MARRKTRTLKADPPESLIKLEIPLPDDGVGSEKYWSQEIEASEERLRNLVPTWRGLIERYEGGKPSIFGLNSTSMTNVNVGYYTVEQKKPQLCFETPFVVASPARADVIAIAPVVQAIVNEQLQRENMNAAGMIDEVLSDVLVSAGVGPSKIGFDRVQVEVDVPTNRMVPVTDEQGQPVIDPVTLQPQMTRAVNPKTGLPETMTVPKTIYERWYWNRFSPADFLRPRGFTSTNFDAAPWLAMRFAVSEQMAEAFGVNVATMGDVSGDRGSLMSEDDRKAWKQCGYGVEVWYKASLIDPTEKNPERIRQLVILGGMKGRTATVVLHRNSPYQVFGENGEFEQGMKGFPIHPCTIRTTPDTSFTKSDCEMLKDVGDEKNITRTLQLMQRRRNLPVRGFDKTRVRKEQLDKLESAETQSLIGFDGDPREQIVALDRANIAPENFEIDRIQQQDIDRLSASGANQQGLPSDGSNTATEQALIQRAADTRQAKERTRFLTWLEAGVEKAFALIQLFADQERVVKMVGENGAATWQAWDKTKIQGRFAFTIKPDSAIRIDAAQEREHYLRLMNLTINHPLANADHIIRTVVGKFGEDPSQWIKQAPPPPPQEKPKVSVSLKGEDLNPLAPQYVNVVHILQANGIEGMAPAQTPPVKSPQGIPPVDKHDAALTGELSGPGPSVLQ